MSKEGFLPVIDEILKKRPPFLRDFWSKIGIYPIKASIHQGAEISYNLYEKSMELNKIDQQELYDQHEHKLRITVHKGTVIKAGEQLNFQSGFGEQIIIKTPSFYTIDDRWRGTLK